MGLIKASGLYKGIVIDTDDPSGSMKRVRVRIPRFHGTITDSYSHKNTGASSKSVYDARVKSEYLPWCEVAFPFGSNVPPEVGQVVIVGFLSSDVSQPVVLGWLGYDYTSKENDLQADVANLKSD
jgi:uncharacterized protein involved in type VI secretion and phage assembly